MAVQLLTIAEYARHRGCDEKAVRKAIKENRITAIPDEKGRNRIDPAVADIQWAQNTRARADSTRGTGAAQPQVQGELQAAVGGDLGPDAAPVGDDYQSLRVRRERAAVEREERENAKEAGLLVERAAVERAVFDMYRALRDAIMASGPRAAPKLIGVADARDIERVIADEQRKAFDGWEARMLERLQSRGGA